MKTIQFTVPGEPRGKGRPRFTRSGHAYTDQKTRDYERHVARCYLEQVGMYTFPEDSPLRVEVLAVFGMPKNVSKARRAAMLSGELKPRKKPDGDNVLKIVLDGLQGVSIPDDKNVTNAQIIKRWGAEPRLEIFMTEELK